MDFKNTVIVMTSNLGSSYILEGIKDGRITEEARAQVNLLLKQSFRPEFLNRIDDIVFYKPLDKERSSRSPTSCWRIYARGSRSAGWT